MMPQTNKGYRRRNSLRHPAYDYTTPGAYFVTICQYQQRCVFGQIVDQEMILNPLGQLAVERLTAFAERHAVVTIDAAVIMPNHGHLLLWLNRLPGPLADAPVKKERKFGDAIAGSLSTLIGAYKGSVRQTALNRGLWSPTPLWQDDFYDHIVRNEADLARIRDYINNNPARWLKDQLHPDAPPNPFNCPQ